MKGQWGSYAISHPTEAVNEVLPHCIPTLNPSPTHPTPPPLVQVLDSVRAFDGCGGATSEQLTDDGFFSIDIALEQPGGLGRIAVEVSPELQTRRLLY